MKRQQYKMFRIKHSEQGTLRRRMAEFSDMQSLGYWATFVTIPERFM